MSWQEELRRLDAELASGKITPHEHRKQRDELLAAASGGGITSPIAAPLLPAATRWQSTNPGSAAADQANATDQTAQTDQTNQANQTDQPAQANETDQAKQAQPDPQPESEKSKESEDSQAAAPAALPLKPAPKGISAKLLASGRPTTAPSPADERPTDYISYPPMSEAPTVITRPLLPPDLPGLTPATPQGFPGIEGQPNASVATKRPARTWLVLSVGVFVVLCLIGGATWFFSAPSTSTDLSAPPNNLVNPQLDVENKLPELPGTPNSNNSTMSIDKAVQLQIITADEASKIRASGAQEIVYRASADIHNVNNGYLMLAIPTGSAGDAAKLVRGLRETLTGAGFKPDPIGPGEAGAAYTGSNPNGQVSALWYASGSVVIGIGVSGPLDAAPATLRTRLTQVRDTVAATLPPS